ncbi:hypothetical protein CTM_09701 [Clostridium tetanomorphum DSM 665]|nr:hypothetical protein CTM_09701 [Clostridium tetanomorphum DSM 665]
MFMKNNKKCLSVLSTAAMGTLIATALTSGVSAKTTDVIVKLASQNVKFNFSELNNSYEDKSLGLEAPLYDKFSTNEGIISLLDDKTGYVDYKAVSKAAEDAAVLGKDFALDTFTEAAKGDQILPEVKIDAEWKDGQVTPVDGQLKVESVSAITDSKLNVKLSKAVDEAKAENFKIEGMTVISATLSENKKEITLKVSGAEVKKGYNVLVTGLKVSGETQKDMTYKFTMPDISSLYSTKMTIKDDRTFLKSDGSDSALVTFELTDSEGNVVTDAGDVEVGFTTTFGNFAEKRVTLQNGKATVMLISEALNVERTAILRATVLEAANKNLINLTATRNMLMTPNPDNGGEEKLGATLTDVLAEQADRVILYFNKDVPIEKYVNADGSINDKVSINVRTEAANDMTAGKPRVIKGLKEVPGNSKALYVILDTSSVLTDNANVAVDFSDGTGTVPTSGTKMTKLTDARRPAMLGIEREGLKTIKVTFSEAVVSNDAEKPENWVIDGFQLGNDKWGVGTNKATAKVGTFNAKTGEDTRNVVTITLGKDINGDQIYFVPETHSLQGSNIGDWANQTDDPNNVMNTQTLDFVIPEDVGVPDAKVEVQSPEQYIVTFNKEITKDLSNEALIKLQRYNTTLKEWKDVPIGSMVKDQQELKVTRIGTENVKFKVEVKQDWTKFYDTGNTNKNYFNDSYRLVIEKDKVVAASNGKKNVEILMPLDGAMKTPDVTSPIISKIEQAKDEQGKLLPQYKVTMSEPIKMPGGGDTLPTEAQGQPVIPQPTAEFIKKDNSQTIQAKAITKVLDDYDTVIEVEPTKALDPGEWTLVVRSISDDVGNTAASATKAFTVEGTPVSQEKFKILWAVADTNYSDGFDTLTDEKNTLEKDAVYIKFNKPVKVSGSYANALTTSNYTLNGAPLPTGTQIVADIKNYDDKDAQVDSITIVLPNGTLTNAKTTVVTISNFIESIDGEQLTNGGQKKLPYQINGDVNTEASVKDADEFKAAIAKDAVRVITLTDNIDVADLTIGHPVDINLNGKTLKANISYNFTLGATVKLDNGTLDGDLTVNTPNAEFINGSTVTGTVNIKDVVSGTFVNQGTIANVVITDANGSGFKNDGGTVTGKVTVNTTGAVALGGNITNVEVTKAAKLAINGTVTNLNLTSDAKGVKVTGDSGSVINMNDSTGEKVTVEDKVAPTVSNIKVNGQNVTISANGVIDLKAATENGTKAVTSATAVLSEDATAEVTIGGNPISKAVKTTDTFKVLSADENITPEMVSALDGVTVTLTDAAGNVTTYTLDTK